MFAYFLLCCLMVNIIDCSVVRKTPSDHITLETREDTDFVNLAGNEQHLRRERFLLRFGREASERIERAAPAHPAITGTENPKKVEVDIDNRFGIRVGKCPVGFVKRGGFCFPESDY